MTRMRDVSHDLRWLAESTHIQVGTGVAFACFSYMIVTTSVAQLDFLGATYCCCRHFFPTVCTHKVPAKQNPLP